MQHSEEEREEEKVGDQKKTQSRYLEFRRRGKADQTAGTPGSSLPTVRVQSFVHVDFVREGVAQSHGSEEHLHADDEVLVTSSDRSLPHGEVRRGDLRDGAALLQDGQQHP